MANGAKVALGVGAGYLLGRTRKTKLALMLALGGLTGKLTTNPTAIVGHGLKSLGASSDVKLLSDQVRGELLQAARAAAFTAATSQVNALNNRLQGVTSAVGVDETLEDVGDTVGGVTEPVTSLVGLGRSRSRRDADVDDVEPYEDDDQEPLDVDEDIDEEDYDEEDFDDEDDQDEADLDEADLDETDVEEEPDEVEEPPPPPRRRRAGAQPTKAKASVRRSDKASQAEPRTRAARRRPAAASATATKRAPVRRGRRLT